MAEGGKLAGAIIVSIIIGAGLGYGLTWLLQPSGSILQTKYLQLTSQNFKSDDDLTKTGMTGTHLNITTKGQSYLIVDFSCTLGYHLDQLFTGVIRFNISLEVDGTEVARSKASWYAASAIGNAQEGTEQVTLNWVSKTLPAGTYTANMTWTSLYDAPGVNQIYASTPNMNTSRTLMIQEIRAPLF
ncbi:MAG TPA: hypothetical protein VKM55_16140 [Candidatus Lokiarchaeia archaeon]|nr:hypothetical protein [Candidatus Lokiarchaeia archaeon]